MLRKAVSRMPDRNPIRIGVFESPPLMTTDGHSIWRGPVIDALARYVFRGRPIRFEGFTFDDVVMSDRRDRFDFFCGLFASRARSEQLFFYPPLLSIPMVAVSGSGQLIQPSDLKDQSHAVQVEGDLGSELLPEMAMIDMSTLTISSIQTFEQWATETKLGRDSVFTVTDALTAANVFDTQLRVTFDATAGLSDAFFCLARPRIGARRRLDAEVMENLSRFRDDLRGLFNDGLQDFRRLVLPL